MIKKKKKTNVITVIEVRRKRKTLEKFRERVNTLIRLPCHLSE